MLKKLLLFLFLLLSGSSVFAACTFDSQNVTCPRFSNGFFVFTFTSSLSDSISNISGRLYLKSQPTNEIPIVISLEQVTNTQPLVQDGLYELELNFVLRNQQVVQKRFEFSYDSALPAPVYVPQFFAYSGSQITLTGVTALPNTDVLISGQGTVKSNSQGIFSKSVSLSEPVSLITFTALSSQNIESEKVYRVVYSTMPPVPTTLAAVNTIAQELVSSQLYVSGSADLGNYVIVAGRRVPVLNGKFGVLVLLSEGQNTIKIIGSNGEQSISITHTKPLKFDFVTISIPKIVSTNSISLSYTTTVPEPVTIFLNGKRYSILGAAATSGVIEGLIPGRNTLVLEGSNGKKYTQYVYYDSVNPQVTDLTSSFSRNLVFKILDDVSKTSFKLYLDNSLVSDVSVDSIGNYYSFNPGSRQFNSYRLEVFDSAGHSTSVSGSKSFAPFSLKSIHAKDRTGKVTSVFVQGKQISIPSSAKSLVFGFSRPLALHNLYIDNIEHVNYTFYSDNSLEIFLPELSSRGEFSLNAMVSQTEDYEFNFEYLADQNSAKIELDSFSQTILPSNSLFISGKVSPEFDRDSLRVNGQVANNVSFFYGSYFEGYIYPKSETFTISGRDYVNNTYSKSSTIVFDTESQLSFSNDFSMLTLDTLQPTFPTLTYLHKPITSTFFKSGLLVSMPQVQGYTPLNIELSKKSGLVTSLHTKTYVSSTPLSFETFSSDSGILLVSPNSGVSFTSSQGVVSQSDSCTLGFTCSLLSATLPVQVTLSDLKGNNVSRFISTAPTQSYQLVSHPFNVAIIGSVSSTLNSQETIYGNMVSTSRITEVKVSPFQVSACEFTQESFACPVRVNSTTQYTITIVDSEGSHQITHTITKKNSISAFAEITSTQVDSGYKYDDSTYFVTEGSKVSFVLSSINASKNYLLINGKKELITTPNVYELDLSEFIAGKTEAQVSVQLVSESEQGIASITNPVKLIYTKLTQALISIILG
jgi:hypothetical protein